MSRADYYNNPGNLRPNKNGFYEGQIGTDKDGFAVFETPEAGRKALLQDIRSKVEEQKLNTPEAFIDKYAPKGDNSEETRKNYKIHIAEQLGLDDTTKAFPGDYHEKLANAIAKFEGSTLSEPQEAPQSEQPTGAVLEGENPYPPAPEETVEAQQQQVSDKEKRAYAGAISGVVGAGAGTKALAAKKAFGVASRFFPAMSYGEAPHPAASVGPTTRPGGNGVINWWEATHQGQVSPLTDLEKQNATDYKNIHAAGKQAEQLHSLVQSKDFGKGYGPVEGSSIYLGPTAAQEVRGALPAEPSSPGVFRTGLGVLGKISNSLPVRTGLAGFGAGYNAQDLYNAAQKGDITGQALAGTGLATDLYQFLPRWFAVTKASPIVNAISGGTETARRAREGDITGASIAGAGTLAPIAASLLAGPEALPIGLAAAYGAPLINAMRDLYPSQVARAKAVSAANAGKAPAQSYDLSDMVDPAAYSP